MYSEKTIQVFDDESDLYQNGNLDFDLEDLKTKPEFKNNKILCIIK